MKITTLNLNGLRAASKKGFRSWLEQSQPDVLCLQEVRAEPSDAPEGVFDGWNVHWNPALKKGYAGTAIVTRVEGPAKIVQDLPRVGEEGRLIGISLPQLDVWSVYVHSGSSGEEKQAWKMEFLGWFRPWLDQVRAGRPAVICGDINICHTPLDIKNAKGNEKNSGFLPEERAWLSGLFASGWQDAFRQRHPDAQLYSWWSQRGGAYDRDVGWRIDQHWLTPGLRAREVWIERDARLSDHAPVNLELESF